MAFLGLDCFFTSTDEESDRWYQKAANQYDDEAQFALAKMLYNGDVKQDYQEAFKQCQKAANKRNADAQYMLAMMYQDGKGIAQDHKEAVKWLIKAAWKGNAKAQSMLRQTYSEADIKQAHQQLLDEADRLYNEGTYGLVFGSVFDIYKPLAEDGNPRVIYRLGTLYCDGYGVGKDFQKGFKLIQKAAYMRNKDALQQLKAIDFNGKDIPKDKEEYYKLVKEKLKRNENKFLAKKLLSYVKRIERWDLSIKEYREVLGNLGD